MPGHDRNKTGGPKGKMGSLKVLLLAAMLAGVSLLLLAGCGEEAAKEEEPTTFEIAMITDSTGVDDGSFRENTWQGIQAFSEETGTTSQFYVSEEDNDDSYMAAIRTAQEKGAKICVFAGNQFETTVHKAQEEFEDLYFILIDGVPRDEDYNYRLAANSTGVLFAEEQAGYLAGYAAVCDGYKRLGFIGGKDVPAVKRYGAGFVQGISAAAKDKGISGISVKYAYSGTFEASEKIEKSAAEWYEEGTEVIFACGGAIGESVIIAADGKASQPDAGEKEGDDAKAGQGEGQTAEAADSESGAAEEEAPEGIGKVIGVDTDQSAMSPNVITSAKKRLDVAVTDLLKTYIHNSFKGNSIFNYTIENDGISLEMANSRFNTFGQSDYDALISEIKDGRRSIAKEAVRDEISSLAGEGVTVEEISEEQF